MCNGKSCCGGGCVLRKIRKVLLIAGGLNWGLVGVGMLIDVNLNVIYLLFGGVPALEAAIYVLLGLAAILKIFGCRCKECMTACANCEVSNTDAKV
ncbi:MAG: DUF378 domain-containing protein [bacterium]